MPETDTKQTKDSFDSLLDAVLEAAENNGQNRLEVAQRLHERDRKRKHAKAKATQPDLGVRGTSHHQALLDKLKAFWDAPLADEDKNLNVGALEYLLLTIQDTLDAADVEDLICALMRVGRKALAGHPHLWRKQDFPKPEPEPPQKPTADTAK